MQFNCTGRPTKKHLNTLHYKPTVFPTVRFCLVTEQLYFPLDNYHFLSIPLNPTDRESCGSKIIVHGHIVRIDVFWVFLEGGWWRLAAFWFSQTAVLISRFSLPESLVGRNDHVLSEFPSKVFFILCACTQKCTLASFSHSAGMFSFDQTTKT